MAYTKKTGRGRTLRFQGEMHCDGEHKVEQLGSGYIWLRRAVFGTTVIIYPGWFKITARTRLVWNLNTGTGHSAAEVWADLIVQNEPGSFSLFPIDGDGQASYSVLVSRGADVPFSVGWVTHAEAHITGSFDMSIKVEEYRTFDGMPGPPRFSEDLRGPQGPVWTGVVDATGGFSEEWFEALKTDASTVSLSCEFAGMSHSQTWAYNPGINPPLAISAYEADTTASGQSVSTEGPGGDFWIRGLHSAISLGHSHSRSNSGVGYAGPQDNPGGWIPGGHEIEYIVTPFLQQRTWPWYRNENTNAGPIVHVEGLCTRHVFNSSLNSWDNSYITVVARLYQAPKIAMQVQGIVQTLEGASFPSTLSYRWHTSNEWRTFSGSGSFSDSAQWVARLLVTMTDGNGPNIGANDGWQYIYIDSPSLAAAGEDGGDNRILMRSDVFDGISIVQASSLAVDTMSSGTGWSSSGSVTVTSTGTTIQLASAAAGGNATKTYSSKPHVEPYRYLRVKIRSIVNGAVPLILKINNYEWDIVTAAANTYGNIDVDLASPDRVTGGAYLLDRDSRFPIATLAGNRPIYPARLAGVDEISTFGIDGIPNGETIEIDDLTMQRLRGVEGSIMPTFKFWNKEIPDLPLQEQYCKRGLLAIVDGKQGLEVPYQRKIVAVTEAYPALSIADFVAYINKFPGWTAVDLAGAGDPWFNNSLPSYFVGGAGSIRPNNGGAVVDWFTFNPATTKTIQSQFLIDALKTYPGCGDVFAQTGYNTDAPVVMRFQKFMRGLGHGMAIDAAFKPVSGATVTIRELPGHTAAGSGVSDAGGYFKTGTPYGRSSKDHEFVSGSNVLGSRLFTARRRHRVSGLTSAEGAKHLTLRRRDGLFFELSYSGATIRMTRIDLENSVFDTFTVADVQVDSAQNYVTPFGECAVVFEQSGTIYITRSTSNADTWSEPMALPFGTSHDPIPASDEDNGIEYIVFHDGTGWKTARLKPTDTVWSVLTGYIFAGARGKGGLEVGRDLAHSLLFTIDDGGSTRRFVSHNEGDTWTEL